MFLIKYFKRIIIQEIAYIVTCNFFTQQHTFRTRSDISDFFKKSKLTTSETELKERFSVELEKYFP